MEQNTMEQKTLETRPNIIPAAPSGKSTRNYMQNRYPVLSLLLLVSCTIASCTGYSSTGGPGTNTPPAFQSQLINSRILAQLTSVYIAPLEVDRQVAGDLSGFAGHSAILTRKAQSLLKMRVSSEAANQDKLVLNTSLANQALFQKNAAVHGAQSILITTINRYQDRKGGRLGAEQGAAVSFSMQLLLASNPATEIWRASYRFKDQAVTENLLRIAGDSSTAGQAGWGTAGVAFENGIASAIQDIALKHREQMERGYP